MILNLRLYFPCYTFTISTRTITRRTLKRPVSKLPVIPVAKSKRYNVVQVPWQKPEDVRELLWKRHAYLNALASIRLAFRKEREEKEIFEAKKAELSAIQRKTMDEEGFDEIVEHNRMMAEKREIRQKEETKEQEEAILYIIEKHLRISEEIKAKREKVVAKMIEMSENFITPENATEKIGEALETIVDYNYALDTDGNVYTGHKMQKYLEVPEKALFKVSEESAPAVKTGKLKEFYDERLKYL